MCSPFGHSRRSAFVRSVRPVSAFLCPFAPRTLLRFLATTDTLTPDRAALRRTARLNSVLLRPGLPDSQPRPSPPSAANHLTRPGIAPRSFRVPGLPFPRVRASSLASQLAAPSGRIAFVILRTTGSRPVALHLVSRRRSYLPLPGASISRKRTFTSLVAPAFRRTGSGVSPLACRSSRRSIANQSSVFNNRQ